MITAYHRPTSLDQALELLRQPGTVPLGGGTLLSASRAGSVIAVDLQALGLDQIARSGNEIQMGATLTLQSLAAAAPFAALERAIKLEAPLNIRNAATLAGTIASCDGRSPLTTALLALDARLDFHVPGSRRSQGPARPETIGLGEYLPLRTPRLITALRVHGDLKLAFEYVSRTPADKPIVCVALARWPSGRTRLAVGGFGGSPMLAMDGTEAEGIESAARNALHDAGDDWASAEYRMDAAAVLARRALARISAA
jgi:CO/xanthine dehydrogenase FAD-binding subunit